VAYTIRYADSSYAKILGVIHAQSWKVAYKGIIPDEVLDNITAEKREQRFYTAITERGEENFLIFKGEEAAGFLMIEQCRDEDLDETHGEICGIYLHPDYWNQGIGAKLMNWGLEELKNRGYKTITLWVLEENVRAREFYEKLGFSHDGTVKELNIGGPINECRYIKKV
jgi:ribosomal protein S18 acetylase RimI-like enzyme